MLKLVATKYEVLGPSDGRDTRNSPEGLGRAEGIAGKFITFSDCFENFPKNENFEKNIFWFFFSKKNIFWKKSKKSENHSECSKMLKNRRKKNFLEFFSQKFSRFFDFFPVLPLGKIIISRRVFNSTRSDRFFLLVWMHSQPVLKSWRNSIFLNFFMTDFRR